MYIFSFFDNFLFVNIFILLLDFAKKYYFSQICNFLQILKVEHKSFQMMYHLSYLDIKYGILSGGGSNCPPPQRILVFNHPSSDRVKFTAQVLDQQCWYCYFKTCTLYCVKFRSLILYAWSRYPMWVLFIENKCWDIEYELNESV